jgi:hypothetical protein
MMKSELKRTGIKKHPAFAGCCAGDIIADRFLKWKGVFDVGALLPQFLAELTSTLNSRICKYNSTSAQTWQA